MAINSHTYLIWMRPLNAVVESLCLGIAMTAAFNNQKDPRLKR